MWLELAIVLAMVVGLIVWATTRKSRFGHWARVTVMILSGGFIFPNVMTEDTDIAKEDAKKGSKVKNQ